MTRFDSTKIRFILRVPADKDKDVISQQLGGIRTDRLDLGRYTERQVYGLYRIRKLFEEHDVSQFNWGADQVSFYKATDSACTTIFDTYKCALSGHREEAFALLYSYYFERGLINDFIKEVDKDTKFYRLRPSDEYRLFREDEMFHLPTQYMELIAYQHFSL